MTAFNYTNMTTISSFLQAANSSTNGAFWTGMYFMFIGVLFFALLLSGIEVALMVSLFGGIVTGILLLYMGLISPVSLGIVIGAEIFMFIYFMWSSNKNQ